MSTSAVGKSVIGPAPAITVAVSPEGRLAAHRSSISDEESHGTNLYPLSADDETLYPSLYASQKRDGLVHSVS